MTTDSARSWLGWMILPLRRYARFSGRSGRREFWFYCLFLVLGYLGVFVLAIAAALVSPDDDLLIGSVVVGGWVLFFLANFVPGLALSVRRLHDLDLSGAVLIALALAMLVLNMIGWLAYLVVMSLPSKRAGNRHGPRFDDQNELGSVFA